MDLSAWQELTEEERNAILEWQNELSRTSGKNIDVLGQYDAAGAYKKMTEGKISALEAQGQLAGAGIDLTPEQTEFLNNKISQEASDKANEFTEHMRDTSITSAADQYSSLGLNPASVMQTGGAGIGGSSTADVSNRNTAQEKMLNQVNQKAAMTRTMLGIVGGLASAGIYGGAITAGRVAAARIASSTAHSAQAAMQSYGKGVMSAYGHTYDKYGNYVD